MLEAQKSRAAAEARITSNVWMLFSELFEMRTHDRDAVDPLKVQNK